MRRLLLLVAVIVAVDTALYAALTPLLPHFVHELGLSKGSAGVLAGAYAAGALVGGIPGGVAAARLGARRAVLVGLTLMGLASLGFAVAPGFWGLFGARFVQGCGSAFTWSGAFAWLLAATPRERRGQVIGTAMGAAVFGALFGPVIGAAAALAGREPVFGGLSALAVVLGVWTLRLDPTQPEQPSFEAVRRALRNRDFLGGLLFMTLPALLFGVLGVLGPLYLSAVGWGAAAIGVLWLADAGLEAAISPFVGRFLDRRGRMPPVRIALLAAIPLSFGLAAEPRPLAYVPLIVLASAAYGVLFVPSFALIADGAEQVALPQGMAFGVMNAGWATGGLLGPAAGGALADATGDAVAWLICAGLCAASLGLTFLSRHHRPAVLVDRLAGDAAGVGRE